MSILTSADKFRYELESLLDGEIDRLKDSLSLGFVESFDQYKLLAGRIAGLRSALDLMKEAEAICNGKER